MQHVLSTSHYMVTLDEGNLAQKCISYMYARKLTGRDMAELSELAQNRDVRQKLVV